MPGDQDVNKEPEDPTRPTMITAHAVARVADRIPFSRRISRHMEGTENRAGILSDVLNLAMELIRRNPQAVKRQVESLGDELQKVRDTRAETVKRDSTEGLNNHAA